MIHVAMNDPATPPPPLVRDQQTHRAAANALWPPLRDITNLTRDWPHGTAYTVNDPTGNPRSSNYSSAAGFPAPIPRIEPIGEDRLLATVDPDDWPRSLKLAVRLPRPVYEELIQTTDDATLYEWRAAAWGSNSRHAFTRDENRHGTSILRRNPKDPHITPRVAALLEAIAAASFIELVTPEREALIEDALIRDEEIDATVVFAIAQRAGLEGE